MRGCTTIHYWQAGLVGVMGICLRLTDGCAGLL